MYYYNFFDLTIQTPFELDEVNHFGSTGKVDIQIHEEEFSLPQMQVVPNLYRMNANPMFGGTFNDVYFDWKEFGAFRIRNGNTITFNKKSTESKQFKHFLLAEPLTMALYQRGHYLLHASAIVLPNKEVCIFFGEPGAGKSTITATFLQAGCTFLSDDLVAITFDEHQQPYVLPAFPNIKLFDSAIKALYFDTTNAKPLATNSSKYGIIVNDKFHRKAEKLKYVFELEKSENLPFSITATTLTNAHLQPMRHFPLPMAILDNEDLKKRFMDGVKIQKATQSFKITRNSNSFSDKISFVTKFVEENL